MKCSSCSAELSPSHRYCPSCGALRDSISSTPTEFAEPAPGDAGPAAAAAAPSAPIGTASFDSASGGRFAPGTILAGRYRVIALLGRGGMGEVYRADDLKLGQQVALKFLPKEVADDPARRERFYAEVRIARQVTHPNICRVHDIAEFNGLHFITMEFVDGEDLASLLKRIGCLHGAKALDIARQLCAGLAAAHDKGVLHRDLKPANVMIDGRGQVRITDFGLAVSAGEATATSEISGTPAYMAPEQFSGEGASVRSDIYALGLVLYEIYTGRRAFVAQSLAELVSYKTTRPPTPPSEIVHDMDPAIERLILRCLESDPEQRPDSVARIMAEIPSGDPLGAMIAAGKTPSPEMLAAAGETSGMRPAAAVACLAGIIAGLMLLAYLGGKVNWAAQATRGNSPDVLTAKAREIVRRLGYTDPGVDSASGLAFDTEYLKYMRGDRRSPDQWDRLTSSRPSAVYFWYRESPQFLVQSSFTGGGRVLEQDPPPAVSGMVAVRLDMQGRLISLAAVPPQLEQSGGAAPASDWAALFAAGGFDSATFSPADPKWAPAVAFDARSAWAGVYPDQAAVPLHIEAAAYHGKPVYFDTIGPWRKPTRMQPDRPAPGERALQFIAVLFFFTLIIGAILLARYNFKRGRGDRRGASRLAFFVMAVDMLRWLFGASHVPTLAEAAAFLTAAVAAMFWGGLMYVTYLALEPFVRKRWPAVILSWSRILAGRLRDSMVGRDLLTGILLGTGLMLLQQLAIVAMIRTGSAPTPSSPDGWLGVRFLIAYGFLGGLESAIMSAMFVIFLICLLRALTRRLWLSVGIIISIFTLGGTLMLGGDLRIAIPYVALMFSLIVFVLLRYGFVSLAATLFVQKLLDSAPISTDFSAWYSGSAIFVLAAVLTASGLAFHTALAGRPLFRGRLLED